MGFKEALEAHGEVEVQLENDRVYELHLDADFVEDGGRTVVTFLDPEGTRRRFYADAVVNWWTHRSHVVE